MLVGRHKIGSMDGYNIFVFVDVVLCLYIDCNVINLEPTNQLRTGKLKNIIYSMYFFV